MGVILLFPQLTIFSTAQHTFSAVRMDFSGSDISNNAANFLL